MSKVSKPPLSFCAACGDPGAMLFRGKQYCPECHDELAFGKVPFNQPTPCLGGGNANWGCGDPNPGFENAVRCLEDNP